MDRTQRAALVAAAIAGGTVAFFGIFLGFDPLGSLVVAGLAALLAAVLIGAAARRAESFAEPTPPSPGFPGPPDQPDGSLTDPTDPATPDDEDR